MKKVKIISPRECTRPAIAQIIEKGEHITLALTICGDGSSLSPILILPLKTLPKLPTSLPFKFLITGAKEGWITGSIMHRWAEDVLKNAVEERRKLIGLEDAPCLLIIDNHSSRQNPEFLATLERLNVDVFFLPPNCTHILQPLDLMLFFFFHKELKACFHPSLGESGPSRRQNLIYSTALALQSSMREDRILGGFMRAGIVPFNQYAPLDSSFVVDPEKKFIEKKVKGGHRGRRITDTLVPIGSAPGEPHILPTEPKEEKKEDQRMEVSWVLN